MPRFVYGPVMESEAEASSSPFGVRPGEMIGQAWPAYWANRNQLTLYSLVSILVYYASIQLVSDDQAPGRKWRF